MDPRLTNLTKALGIQSVEKIQKARVLVIGAGGIGCELLKNLVQNGFTDIEVVDLDTIDVSNLNRQFLFRKKDVGSSKSRVAKESVLRFNPNVKMVAHHGNVKNGDKFNAAFVKQFTVVANALDNVGARRHVNRLCVKAGVPLVESGSTGYLGQATIHYGGVCECYDCRPKATPKVHPICSVRSEPEKYVHCIEYGKQMFRLLFGAMEDSMLSDSSAAAAAEEEEESMAANPSQEDATKSSSSSSTETEAEQSVTEIAAQRPTVFDQQTLRDYAKGVLRAFFTTKMHQELEAREFKIRDPIPFDFNGSVDTLYTTDVSDLMHTGGSALQQTVWTVSENASVFVRCIEEMWNEENRISIGSYEFDKDNRTALDFVIAASNLRASVFSMKLESPFGVKQIAGNIVHAIATTNAMAAGLEMMEILKIVTIGPENKEEIKKKCKYTGIFAEPTRKGHILVPATLEPPNKKCPVCSEAGAVVTLDVTKTTLVTFLTSIVKAKLGFSKPEFDVGNDINRVWMYPDDYEDDGGADKFDHIMIDQLPGSGGIQDGSVVTMNDDIQGTKIDVKIIHQKEEDFDKEKHPEFFSITYAAKSEANEKEDEGKTKDSSGKGDEDDMEIIEDDDDDFLMIIEDPAAEQASEKKRNSDDDALSSEPAKKRCKVGE